MLDYLSVMIYHVFKSANLCPDVVLREILSVLVILTNFKGLAPALLCILAVISQRLRSSIKSGHFVCSPWISENIR